jgi:hypothetical protein
MLPQLSPLDARGAERRRVGMRATLREFGSQRLEVDVLDLSVTGFRVESIYSIAVGARVYLTIPTFSPLEAVIAWRVRYGYGCKFVRPLHPAVFDTICARYSGI